MLGAAVAEARAKRGVEREGRQRAVGGGRRAKLSLARQLLVVLMYYRLYITQILLGYLFDLDDSNVSRLIGELRPVLQAVLPLPVQETLLFAKPKKRIPHSGHRSAAWRSCSRSIPNSKRCLSTLPSRNCKSLETRRGTKVATRVRRSGTYASFGFAKRSRRK